MGLYLQRAVIPANSGDINTRYYSNSIDCRSGPVIRIMFLNQTAPGGITAVALYPRISSDNVNFYPVWMDGGSGPFEAQVNVKLGSSWMIAESWRNAFLGFVKLEMAGMNVAAPDYEFELALELPQGIEPPRQHPPHPPHP